MSKVVATGYISGEVVLARVLHILSERYRNRRKRFALRFSLIAGICNFDRLAKFRKRSSKEKLFIVESLFVMPTKNSVGFR